MFLLAIFGWNDLQAEIIIYPVPNGIYYARHNDDYTVLVRQAGDKEWIDLYEYNVKVDMDTKSDATMVQFDFPVRWISLFGKIMEKSVRL